MSSPTTEERKPKFNNFSNDLNIKLIKRITNSMFI